MDDRRSSDAKADTAASNAAQSPPGARLSWPRLRQVTLFNAVLGLTTAVAVTLHVVRFGYAGELWRDEASSMQTSTAPTWERFWDIWRFDSFPPTWIGALRAWCELPGGETHTGLRLLGSLIGVAIVAALWLNARWMGHRFPVVALALFALNPTVLIYGDSLRAYGLGVLLELVLFGLLWRLGQHVSRRRFIAATIVAILTVHCLYNHALTLFAMGVGVMTACALRRAWREAVAILAIGLIAAVSLVPLLPNIGRVNENWIVAKSDFSVTTFVSMIKMTVGGALGAWCIAALLSAGVVLNRMKRGRLPDALVVASVTAVTIVGATLAFLLHLKMPTQPWYYINLLAVLAVCADMVLSRLLTKPMGRQIAAGLVALVVVASLPAAWRAAHIRMTNIDLVAQSLRNQSSPDDYVIVFPYYLGVSFNRYYDGPATWVTLPPIQDPSVHRHDQLQQQMMEPDPIGPMLEKIRLTLHQGHRVWLVRQHPLWPADQPPRQLPPAPQSPFGWDSEAYNEAWLSQLDVFLREQAASISRVDPPLSGAVIDYEDTRIYVAQGSQSHDSAAATP